MSEQPDSGLCWALSVGVTPIKDEKSRELDETSSAKSTS
jgi:hypothetical protein